MSWKNVPKYLEDHYNTLESYINSNRTEEARKYLYSLPLSVYDSIVERSARGYCFETIMNRIDELVQKKRDKEIYKLNCRQNDDNFLV